MTTQDTTKRMRPSDRTTYTESESQAGETFGESPYAAYLGSPDTHIGATQPIAVRKGLFEGISVAQVLAAAAAAATSMLLASNIGIAGSVIGAAVSSMVTVVCSQLYRNALDASAQKLRAKQILSSSARINHNAEVTNLQDAAHNGERVLTARIAPTKLQARAAAERSASKRKVALASVAIAIVAVISCAGLIMLSTQGQGLGTKTPSPFGATAQEEPVSAGPADELAASRPSPEGAQTPDGEQSATDTAGRPSSQPEPSEKQANPNAQEEGVNSSNGSTSNGEATPQTDPASGGSTNTDASSNGAQTPQPNSTTNSIQSESESAHTTAD